MKKIIIPALLIGFATASFGQQQPVSNPPSIQTDYLKKSKRQKVAAWITTGIGAMFIVGTLTIENTPVLGEDEIKSVWVPGYYIGGACIATGVVLFIASAKNKKKASAASVFINMEKAPMLEHTVTRNQSFPALGLRLSL